MEKIRYRTKRPIRLWREERGLTQEQVAKRVGISRSHYSNFENGHRPIPDYMINHIAKALAYKKAS